MLVVLILLVLQTIVKPMLYILIVEVVVVEKELLQPLMEVGAVINVIPLKKVIPPLQIGLVRKIQKQPYVIVVITINVVHVV